MVFFYLIKKYVDVLMISIGLDPRPPS